jgi:hypothetical protein
MTPHDLTARLAAMQAADDREMARQHSRDMTVRALGALAVPAALVLAVVLAWRARGRTR